MAGYTFEANRKTRRADKARTRQAEKRARRPIMTQRHPQQEQPRHKHESLREGLTDAQMEILAEGICLVHRICTGPNTDPLPKENARMHAERAINLLDQFADADRDNV